MKLNRYLKLDEFFKFGRKLIAKASYPWWLVHENYGHSFQEQMNRMAHGYATWQEFEAMGKLECNLIIKPFLLKGQDSVVIDYGAGCGRLEPYLSKVAATVYAIEPNKSYRDIGKKHTLRYDNITWIKANTHRTFLSSKIADLVLGFHFIHHIGQKTAKKVLLEMICLAKSEGVVLFNVRFGRNEEWALGKFEIEAILENISHEYALVYKKYRIPYHTHSDKKDAHAECIFYALTKSNRVRLPEKLVESITFPRIKQERV